MASINSPDSITRVRSGRARQKISSTVRSVSLEDSKYIEHLEGELSAARNDNPIISQQHVARMNEVTIENRQLQAHLKDWESRFEEQVRECFQQHIDAERALRNQNETLEEYATKAKDRVVELEAQLASVQKALAASEAANVQLEKRIEIMSELLTSSPAKFDLYAETPGRRRTERPRSMLPRMPVAAPSWIESPQRGPELLMSPTQSTSDRFEILEPNHDVAANISPRTAETISDFDTVSEYRPRSIRRTSTLSEHLATLAESNDPSQVQNRPARRMRRFGAGSNGPKPLILPHASYTDSNPTTAPPLETHETVSSLPFQRRNSAASSMASWQLRRRTVTTSSVLSNELVSSPRDHADTRNAFDRMLSIAQQSDAASATSTGYEGSERRGSANRNLLEELNAIDNEDNTERVVSLNVPVDDNSLPSDDESLEGYEAIELNNLIDSRLKRRSQRLAVMGTPRKQISSALANASMDSRELDMLALDQDDPFRPALESILGPYSMHSPGSDGTPRALLNRPFDASGSKVYDEQAALSTLDKLRTTFGEILKSPTDFARLLVHLTQHRMHLPAPLLSVQWWLVGVLWEPMARVRMLGQSTTETPSQEIRPGFPPQTPSLAIDKSVAYGTVSSSPMPTSARRRAAGMAGPGRKRAGSTKKGPTKQRQESLLAKHHPLLWAKFSVTLAIAIGTAFTSGPGALMSARNCPCKACQNMNR